MNSKVKLIASTVAVALEQHNSMENFVAYCARVSNPANQGNTETSSKLLRYLVRNQHWSPFEMAHVVLEINTTRDIARQILRHRSFSFQEFSQRYAEAVEFSQPKEARLQDAKNRQASVQTDDSHLQESWDQAQQEVMRVALKSYKAALANGVAKEVARVVLPEGLTCTRMYMAGSLRSWYHYIILRTTAGTQKEHREIAEACKEIVAQLCPGLFSEQT